MHTYVCVLGVFFGCSLAYLVSIIVRTTIYIIMYIYIWYFSRTMKYKHTIFSSVLPDPRPVEASKGCLEWHVVQKKVPWGLVLLLGGGFAMGEASDASGLSTWMGTSFRRSTCCRKELSCL